MLENLWHKVDKVWLTVHVVLVTPRRAIGGSKDNGKLGAQRISGHKFAFSFNFNLTAVNTG